MVAIKRITGNGVAEADSGEILAKHLKSSKELLDAWRLNQQTVRGGGMSDQDYENTIGHLDDRIAELAQELQALREAAKNVVLYVHDELHQEELDALQAALKQREGNSG